MDSNYSTTNYESKAAQSALIKNVYLWMCAALAVTGLTALAVSNNPGTVSLIFGSQFMFLGLIIAELVLVFFISARIDKISFATATGLFMLYSLINGLTLSVIFLVFSESSIAMTFFTTAGTFGLMSLYGYFTQKDLTSFGNLLFMLLIGLILATVVNLIFFRDNNILYWITTYAGIFIFVGLTAYDTQKIKQMLNGQELTEQAQKIALLGALSLYLDFINLFLYLLRIFGDRK